MPDQRIVAPSSRADLVLAETLTISPELAPGWSYQARSFLGGAEVFLRTQALLVNPEPRRYRFLEHPYMPPDRFFLCNQRNVAWPWRPPIIRPVDDLMVLFHPSAPDEVVGALVNQLRSQGHAVEVERARRERPPEEDDRP